MADESDVIAEHALETERNLRMAAKIGLSFSTIKMAIVREFLLTLVTDLNRRFGPGWEVSDHWSKSPLGKGYVDVLKASWKGTASIGLHCDKVGPSDLNLYVYVQPELLKGSVVGAELKGALDGAYAHGRKGPHNPWWRYVDPPYRDWNNEDMLVALHRKAEAVEHFVTHISAICKVAAPYLEKFVKTV